MVGRGGGVPTSPSSVSNARIDRSLTRPSPSRYGATFRSTVFAMRSLFQNHQSFRQHCNIFRVVGNHEHRHLEQRTGTSPVRGACVRAAEDRARRMVHPAAVHPVDGSGLAPAQPVGAARRKAATDRRLPNPRNSKTPTGLDPARPVARQFALPPALDAEADVLLDRQMREQRVVLEQVTNRDARWPERRCRSPSRTPPCRQSRSGRSPAFPIPRSPAT